METRVTTIGALVEDAVARRLRHFDNVPSTSTSIEVTLLHDIESLQGLVPRFMRRLNRLRSPILRLPPEILQLIFGMIVPSTHFDTDRVDLWSTRWLVLGHLCSRLRSILLDMHTLWADVIFCRLHGAHEELLRRAHGTPIRVLINVQHHPEICDFALRHLTGSRSIMALTTASVGSFIPSLTSGSFPSLESIALCAMPETVTAQESIGLASQAYHLSNAYMPNLRKLELDDAFIPFDSTALAVLSLRLTDTMPLPPPIPFLSMLRRCSNLRELRLNGWIPDCSAPTLIREPRIEFPALRKMTLQGYRSRIADLWNFVRIPSSAHLYMKWGPSEEAFTDQIQSMWTFKEHALPVSNDSARRNVKLVISGVPEEGYLMFSLFVPCDFPQNPHDHDLQAGYLHKPWRPILELEMYSDIWSRNDISRATGCFCNHYQHASIETLDIDCEFMALVNPPVFTCFPSLKTLYLRFATSEMIDHLGQPLHGPALSTLVLPRLEVLEMYDVFKQEIEAATLIRVLRERSDLGVPVQVLNINMIEENLDSDLLETLETIVPTFDYCGDASTCSEDTPPHSSG